MNQEKIGKFIAKCRKNHHLTQEQLAEKLGITYKAVSKWECGKGLPDASIMIDLCNILEIKVNDLLSGEIIEINNYQSNAETNLIALKKQIDKMRKTFSIISYGRRCPQPNLYKHPTFSKNKSKPLDLACKNSIITDT